MTQNYFSNTVSVADRGFNYGDGIFTTILVKQGEIIAAPYHQQRLEQGCEKLFITGIDWSALNLELNALAKPIDLGVLKVVISRGEGGRGYSPKGADKPQVFITQHTYPSLYIEQRNRGINLNIAEFILGHSPQLAGLKHLNRLEQVMIKREIEVNGWEDALVTDINGNVICASAANLFWFKNGKWYTPDLSHCGINGIMRQRILAAMKELNIEVTIGKFSLEHLLEADSLFICNCLMEIMPVANVGQRAFKIAEMDNILELMKS